MPSRNIPVEIENRKEYLRAFGYLLHEHWGNPWAHVDSETLVVRQDVLDRFDKMEIHYKKLEVVEGVPPEVRKRGHGVYLPA